MEQLTFTYKVSGFVNGNCSSGQPGEIVLRNFITAFKSLLYLFSMSVHVDCNLCSSEFSHSDSSELSQMLSDGLPLGPQDTNVSTDSSNALSWPIPV